MQAFQIIEFFDDTAQAAAKEIPAVTEKIPAATPVIEVLREETDDKSPIVSASGFTSKTDEPKVSPKKASGKKKSRARRKKGR